MNNWCYICVLIINQRITNHEKTYYPYHGGAFDGNVFP